MSVLALARLWRRRGWGDQARQLLEETLEQGVIRYSEEPVVWAQAAWLTLELADLWRDEGWLPRADETALRAVALFERAGDRGGQATAALSLGDGSWHAGLPQRAMQWYERALALAVEVDNSLLQVRARLSLAQLYAVSLLPSRADAQFDEAAQVARDVVGAVEFHGAIAGLSGDELKDELHRAQQSVEAVVALEGARRSARAGRWSMARLSLQSAADVAQKVEAWALYVDILRADAAFARQQSDPRSAVESLTTAATLAERLHMRRLLALINGERVMALADHEQWSQAYALQNEEPPPQVLAQPAVLATRLDGFAVLSLHAAEFEAAAKAAADAMQRKRAAGDRLGALRSALVVADAHRRSGDLEAATEVVAAAREPAASSGRVDLSVGVSLMDLWLRKLSGEPPDKWAHEAAGLVGLAQDGASVAQQIAVNELAAHAALWMGQPELAHQRAAHAVSLSDNHPLVRIRARALAHQASLWLSTHEPERALQGAERAVKMAEQAQDTFSKAQGMLVGGKALVALGRLDEAQLALQSAADLCVTRRQHGVATDSLIALGGLFARQRRHREALHTFQRAESEALRTGSPEQLTSVLRGAAGALAGGGRVDQALQLLERARASAPEAQVDLCVVDGARVWTMAGEPQRGLDALSYFSSRQTSPSVRAEVALVKSQALTMLGRGKEALVEASEAVRGLRGGDRHSFGAALYTQGQLEVGFGDPHHGGQLLAEALVVTAQLGLPEQHQVRQTLEALETKSRGEIENS